MTTGKRVRLVQWSVGALVAIALLTVGAVVIFNRSQPSEIENALANALTSSARRAIANGTQAILFEASRNVVSINAYGFTDAQSQEKVLRVLREGLKGDIRKTKVRVFFFPSREYLVEKTVAEGQVSQLKKTAAIRQVDLN